MLFPKKQEFIGKIQGNNPSLVLFVTNSESLISYWRADLPIRILK